MIRRASDTGAPQTLDRSARTVEVVAATTAPVQRGAPDPTGAYSPWFEVLSAKGCDLSRFIGAPVLADHENATDALIGTVVTAKWAGDELMATIRFAQTPRADALLSVVADGTLRGVSIGYSVQSWARAGDQFTATAWTPLEVSLVPIPADMRAGVRAASLRATKDFHMTDTTDTLAAVAAPPGLDHAAEAVLRMRAQEERMTPADLSNAFQSRLAAVHQVQEAPPAYAAPVATVRMAASYDDPRTKAARMVRALAHRVTGGNLPEDAREFRGLSIVAMAAEMLASRGERVNRFDSPATIIARSLTTSDFPNLLANTTQHVLEHHMAVIAGPVREICAVREVSDFRQNTFVRASGMQTLKLLNEAGEIVNLPPSEAGEPYRVRTYAGRVVMTRQALVNDDLGAFDQVKIASGAAASAEAEAFMAMFATNGAGFGPTLSDTVPLYHANHANLATGAFPISAIGAGRAVMRKQKDPGGQIVGPAPAMVLCGPDRETIIEQSLYDGAVAVAQDERPIFSKLRLLVEPRLTGLAAYLFADPAICPTLAFVTLAGTGGVPQVTSIESETHDGVSVKVTHDFAVCPISHIGTARITE